MSVQFTFRVLPHIVWRVLHYTSGDTHVGEVHGNAFSCEVFESGQWVVYEKGQRVSGGLASSVEEGKAAAHACALARYGEDLDVYVRREGRQSPA